MSRTSKHARSGTRSSRDEARSHGRSTGPRRRVTRKVLIGATAVALVSGLALGAPAALAGYGGHGKARSVGGSIYHGDNRHGLTPRKVVTHKKKPITKPRTGRPASPSPSASTPSTKPNPSGSTLFGASVKPVKGLAWGAAVQQSIKKYGKLGIVRKYYPGLPGPWKNLNSDLHGSIPAVSFKADPQGTAAGKYDAQIKQWFMDAPKDRPTYWTYFHEPENDVKAGRFTPAQFRAAWQHVYELSQQAKNPQLKPTLILMCWTLAKGSHRNFADYYPGSKYVDVLGWDCYNAAIRKNNYGKPEDIFGQAVAVSKQMGKQAAFGEFGSKMARGDNGQGRAQWLKDSAKYLKANDAAYVAYFDSTVGGEFRLLDQWSTKAWRSVCMGES